MLFVLDIDATLASAARRIEAAGPEPSRTDKEAYESWVAAIQNEKSLLEDEAVPGMEELAKAMAAFGRIVYVTSREEKWRLVTERWLFSLHGFPKAQVIMRPNGNWADSAEFKDVVIGAHKRPNENVLMIDDDEHHTIEAMCKRQGYTFLKARSGGQR